MMMLLQTVINSFLFMLCSDLSMRAFYKFTLSFVVTGDFGFYQSVKFGDVTGLYQF